MKSIKSDKQLCTCCMEEHEVKTVLVLEQTLFKNCTIDYEASYFFCELANEYYMDETLIQKNDIKLKDAYRIKNGLLTSTQISEIRAKYGISQIDLCRLLGWGSKTITRYESHQVQDKAHDTILKKINQDPKWFMSLLNDSKSYFSEKTYRKYFSKATSLLEKEHSANHGNLHDIKLKDQVVSLRLSNETMKKAKALGKGYSGILSRMLDYCLDNPEIINKCL